MKYFFGMDLTDPTKEPVPDGAVFISQRLPQSQQRALDDFRGKQEELEKKAKLPLVLRILKTVGMFVALLFAVSILRADVTVFEAYGNAPWVFYSAGVGAVVWALLAIMEHMTGKRVKDSEEYQYAVRQTERIMACSYDLLGVPKFAIPVDVLSMTYSVKNGKVKRAAVSMADYTNPEMMVFVDEEAVYLADMEARYTIPLTCLAGIRKVDKRVSIPGWNKPVAYNKGMFKEYKMTTNKYGQIFFKPYYQLVIRQGNEEYLLEFPPYELPAFQKLTGQRVIDGISGL